MQEVKIADLIQGNEYWMECFTNNDEQQLVPHKKRYKMIAKYDTCSVTKNGLTLANFTNFREIKYKNFKDYGYTVSLNNYYWKFYKTVKNKMQDNMESRAHNTILQRVIRDEYYKY